MTLPDWPAAMGKALAAKYLSLSIAGFEREVLTGRLPHGWRGDYQAGTKGTEMTDVTFTEDDIKIGPILGPEYRASQRLAEAMLEKFDTEHLKPLVDKVADEFRDKLWGDVEAWLLSDTEQNVAGSIRYMVEQTITALLTGEEWAMQHYPYADYTKGEEIREAVCKHGGDTLMARRVADLEAELERKNETIKNMRDWP